MRKQCIPGCLSLRPGIEAIVVIAVALILSKRQVTVATFEKWQHVAIDADLQFNLAAL